jgi:hypothetical protein
MVGSKREFGVDFNNGYVQQGMRTLMEEVVKGDSQPGRHFIEPWTTARGALMWKQTVQSCCTGATATATNSGLFKCRDLALMDSCCALSTCNL